MIDKAVHKFQIIRHRGQPNKLQLPDGTWVEKQNSFLIPEYGGFVPCAPYDNQFLYQIPNNVKHLYPGSDYMCSCGSFACIVGYSGYIGDASPQGKMFVCHHHATFGVHAGGETRWV